MALSEILDLFLADATQVCAANFSIWIHLRWVLFCECRKIGCCDICLQPLVDWITRGRWIYGGISHCKKNMRSFITIINIVTAASCFYPCRQHVTGQWFILAEEYFPFEKKSQGRAEVLSYTWRKTKLLDTTDADSRGCLPEYRTLVPNLDPSLAQKWQNCVHPISIGAKFIALKTVSCRKGEPYCVCTCRRKKLS